jgi:hypothetical protein
MTGRKKVEGWGLSSSDPERGSVPVPSSGCSLP